MPWRRSALFSLLLIAMGNLTASAGDGDGSVGMASFYPGIRASGEFTAAHRSLPFGTRVRVTRVGSGRSVIVRINDRGPFIAGRVIDVSRRAAEALQMIGAGVARVTLQVVQAAAPKQQKSQAHGEDAAPTHLAQRKMKLHKTSARQHQRGAPISSARLKHRRHYHAQAD